MEKLDAIRRDLEVSRARLQSAHPENVASLSARVADVIEALLSVIDSLYPASPVTKQQQKK